MGRYKYPLIHGETQQQRTRRLQTESQKRWRAKNPEKVRAYERKYRRENPEKYRIKDKEQYEKMKASGKIRGKARKYYANNREKILEIQRTRYKQKRQEYMKQYCRPSRAFLNDYKMEHGCAVCGYNSHPAALHFHHVRGEKKFCVSRANTIEEALPEIEKCDILCANCHAILTFGERMRQRNNVKNPQRQIPDIVDNILSNQ